MRRRTRWILSVLSSAVLLVLLGWLGLSLFLPMLVRREVATVFRKLGFESATFELHRTSPWHAYVTAISTGGGADERLRIGEVSISYSPTAAIQGEIDTVRIRDGRLLVKVDELVKTLHGGASSSTTSTSSSSERLPVRSLELESCELIVQGPRQSIELPVSGTLLRAPSGPSQLNLRAMLGTAPLNVTGRIDPTSGKNELTMDTSNADIGPIIEVLPADWRAPIASASGRASLRAEYRSDGPGSWNASARTWLRDAFIVGRGSFDGGEIRGLNINFALEGIRPVKTPPTTQSITAKTIKYAGQEFKDARIEFQASAPDHVDVSAVSVGWAGGGIWADPFVLGPPWTSAALTITLDHVDMKDTLALLTQGRAGGTGHLSGHIPVVIDWPHITFGEGFVASTEKGLIQLGQSTADFSQLLDKSDPRFSRDEQMRQVKEQVTQAMVDFEYDSIRADLRREGDDVVVAIHIQGRGRTGQKQPLDITLNFRGFEHGLNSYLASRSRVFNNDGR